MYYIKCLQNSDFFVLIQRFYALLWLLFFCRVVEHWRIGLQQVDMQTFWNFSLITTRSIPMSKMRHVI